MSNKKKNIFIVVLLCLQLAGMTDFYLCIAEEPAASGVGASASASPVSQQASADKRNDESSAAQPEEAATEDLAEVIQPGNVTVNFKGADIRTVLA